MTSDALEFSPRWKVIDATRGRGLFTVIQLQSITTKKKKNEKIEKQRYHPNIFRWKITESLDRIVLNSSIFQWKFHFKKVLYTGRIERLFYFY